MTRQERESAVASRVTRQLKFNARASPSIHEDYAGLTNSYSAAVVCAHVSYIHTRESAPTINSWLVASSCVDSIFCARARDREVERKRERDGISISLQGFVVARFFFCSPLLRYRRPTMRGYWVRCAGRGGGGGGEMPRGD